VSSAAMVAMLAILVLVALIATITLSPSLSSSSSFADLNQTEREMVEYKNPIVGILANELETKINNSGAILEITSKLPEVNSAPFASSISPELHGIPSDVDMPKRKVAQSILNTDKDFQVIFFLMPNGDVYFLEPYSRQENLTGNNFAFRGYYKGAIETGNTYLDDVVISASSGRPQTNIAVPIYSENNGTLIGVWGGGLNLTSLSKSLQSLNLTSADERVVYVDGQGQKIADSAADNQALRRNTNESFAGLQSFMNAINGGSGTMTEIVNGTMMVVSYHPVNVFYNTWAILFLRPL
jgi:C4-dicarboxylate-specific signal transduction histidine kinase